MKNNYKKIILYAVYEIVEKAVDAFTQQVRIDKVRLLFRQSFPAIFVSLIISAMLTIILWLYDQRLDALWWWGLGALVSSARMGLFASYSLAKPEGEAILAWEKPYFITLFVSSAVWGFGAIWIAPTESLLYQSIIFYFLMGMSGGALSVYSAYRLYTLITVYLILLPYTIWIVTQGETLHLLLATASLLYLLTTIRATRILSDALGNSLFLTHQLAHEKLNAEDMAYTDYLTGLMNRRGLYERALSLQSAQHYPLTMIVLDLDQFKEVNDTYGHAFGDLALQKVARVMSDAVRDSDACARTGGEEFTILLHHAHLKDGVVIAEKIRQRVSANPVKQGGLECRLTVSLGVAEGDDLDVLLRQADIAMYQAKKLGRNRVVSWEDCEKNGTTSLSDA